MDNCLNAIGSRLEDARMKLERLDADEEELIRERDKPYEFDEEIQSIRRELKNVNKELGM